MPYLIVYTSTFKRGFRSLSALDKERVTKALRELASSDSPRILGVRKRGPLAELYAYEIGQKVRILYAVTEKSILLVRVGTHDSVYR